MGGKRTGARPHARTLFTRGPLFFRWPLLTRHAPLTTPRPRLAQVATVVEHLKFDHGYTRSSRAVGFLLEVICEFDDATLATFLKFVTGSPRLPVGGLARLSPRLTIVYERSYEGFGAGPHTWCTPTPCTLH